MIPDRSQVTTYGFAYMNAQYDISKPSHPSTEQHHSSNDDIDMNNNMRSAKIEQKHKTNSPQQQQNSVLNTIRSVSDLSEAERLLK